MPDRFLTGDDDSIIFGSLGTGRAGTTICIVAQNIDLLPDGIQFGITLNATQQKHFLEDAMAGAPMSQLATYLSLEPEKMGEAIQTLGIPTDSIDGGKSEFQEWVKAARDANPDIRLAIKCDAKTPYKMVKAMMSELQDMNENRYQLITNLKTASEE